MRFFRTVQAIIGTAVGIILTCHLWLAASRPRDFTNAARQGQSKANPAENSVRIVQWRQGYLEAIDNQRIVLHETSGHGCLNVRQSCAVESAARHNPERPIQLFMRQQSMDNESRSETWLTVLSHYNNVEIIQLSDETKYFNNTALFSWYLAGKLQQDRDQLSDYFRSVSLFRGGGLFLDLDSVVTIKPLNWMKWKNFFVVNGSDKDNQNRRVTVKMLHLLHGHHLIDEVIINMAKFDLKEPPNGGIMETAIEASMSRICGVNELGRHFENQCLDVRLIDEEDVFLPSVNSSYWRPLRLEKTAGMDNEMINKVVRDHSAVLITWDAMGTMNRNLQESAYSSLLAEHCPFTFLTSNNIIC